MREGGVGKRETVEFRDAWQLASNLKPHYLTSYDVFFTSKKRTRCSVSSSVHYRIKKGFVDAEAFL